MPSSWEECMLSGMLHIIAIITVPVLIMLGALVIGIVLREKFFIK